MIPDKSNGRTGTEKSRKKTVSRVTKLSPKDSSSFEVEFVDGIESQTATGRTDDCADGSTVSSRITEHTIQDGIGKIKKISPVMCIKSL